MILSDTSLSASRILGLLIHELQAVKLPDPREYVRLTVPSSVRFRFVGKLLHVSLSVELRLKRSLPVSFEHVAKELEAIVQDLFNLFYVLGSQKSNGTPAHVGTYHSSEKCVCLLEHPPLLPRPGCGASPSTGAVIPVSRALVRSCGPRTAGFRLLGVSAQR